MKPEKPAPKSEPERKMRGHVIDTPGGRRFVPYFSREDIDTRAALQGRKLELVWVDPVDAFFLHIQGSGTVMLEGGKTLRLNYADKNGQPYEALGKFLRDQIPLENLNLHTIEAYVRQLPAARMQEYFNRNPSYVFFQILESSALTYLGLPATDGRTVATDAKYFPKGGLAFLAFDKPRFDGPTSVTPLPEAEKTGRFVLDQDIGGAITGPGRLDLFWGRGADAKRYAGVIKNPGHLYYLTPKRMGANQ